MVEGNLRSKETSPHRIELVDALRGFALMSIMWLHNIEKFDFYYFSETIPTWIKTTDHYIWESLFFLFGGKSYAIFALLFGFSFFIQWDNQAKTGKDFRLRFLWRLFLLLIIGIINSIFYQGDILALYAVIGVSLLLVAKWNDKMVFFLAFFLMLQPFEWIKIFYLLSHPTYISPGNFSDYYFGQAFQYLSSTSFFELAKGNLWNGRIGVVLWSWENGRFFQAASLFMLGMLLGRGGFFKSTEANLKFWKNILILSSVFFIPLFTLRLSLPNLINRESLLKQLSPVISSYANFSFMLVLVAGFILVYQKKTFETILKLLAPFGRMSLTNYFIQSVIGSFLYYGYGLALYQYMGPTYCFLLGIFLFMVQCSFSHWWLKNHSQGPLERLWHKATWM